MNWMLYKREGPPISSCGVGNSYVRTARLSGCQILLLSHNGVI